MSQEAFFAWAEGQHGRFEFDGCGRVAMTGGTMNHGAIADNIRAELKHRLRGTPCHPVGWLTRAGRRCLDEDRAGEGDVLTLAEIGIELPVAAIYDDVAFD